MAELWDDPRSGVSVSMRMSPQITNDDRITALETECAKLRAENETLRATIYGYRTAHSADPAEPAQPDAVETSVRHDSSTTDKAARLCQCKVRHLPS